MESISENDVPNANTHKVCTSCNAVFAKSHYPLWPLTNVPRHTCVECSGKIDTKYVDTYDAHKPGRTCTTCGKLKNDSGFLKNRKLNECKDCINQYRRAYDRQLAFDKYVVVPSSDESREPPCKSNTKMNKDELKIYGLQQKRRCTKCGIVRDFSFYHKAKGGTFGLSSNCKFCKSRAERKPDFVPKRVKTTRVVPNVNTQ